MHTDTMEQTAQVRELKGVHLHFVLRYNLGEFWELDVYKGGGERKS